MMVGIVDLEGEGGAGVCVCVCEFSLALLGCAHVDPPTHKNTPQNHGEKERVRRDYRHSEIRNMWLIN